MSFWDRIKPSSPEPVATDVSATAGGRTLHVSFDDGPSFDIPARRLRQSCPCAGCVDEWTRRRTFDPATVKPDMSVLEVHPVGNYAVGLRFADGHGSGIFTWSLLRELGQS